MKKPFLFLLVALLSMGIRAQKLDAALLSLAQRHAAEAKVRLRLSAGVGSDSVAADSAVSAAEAAVSDGVAGSSPASLASRYAVSFQPDGSLSSVSAVATLREGAAAPVAELQGMGIEVGSQVGRQLLLRVPADRIADLGEMEQVEWVSISRKHRPLTNRARQQTRVTSIDGTDAALMASGGITTPYTGKGVVVGIIDMGIDYNHAAFRTADGQTRVKRVIDYAKGYKRVYSTAEAIGRLTTDCDTESHGTHVANIAAGSGLSGSARALQGMAPEAQLVLCGLGQNGDDNTILDCVKEVFAYADEAGLPAVINISMGSNTYLHDGSGISETGISTLTDGGNKPGRIVTMSAGNDGGTKTSVVAQLGKAQTDGYQLRTILTPSEVTEGEAYYDSPYVTLYTLEGSSFTVDVKAIDITTGKLYTLRDQPLYDSDLPTKKYTMLSETKGMTSSKKWIYQTSTGNVFFKNPNLRLAFLVRGATAGETMNVLCDGSSDGFTSAGLTGYEEGGDGQILNSCVCTDAIISVGAYSSRISWKAINNKGYGFAGQTEGAICDFSSYGTDDNGITRPDILAPGSALLSAYNSYDRNYFTSRRPQNTRNEELSDRVSLGGTNHFYGVMCGTSMSSPCAAGIIALWLEQEPTLSVADVRKLLHSTATTDAYTTDPALIPSGNLLQAAHGKINALAGMQQLVQTTAIAAPLPANSGFSAASAWFTLQGTPLSAPPSLPGIYLYRG